MWCEISSVQLDARIRADQVMCLPDQCHSSCTCVKFIIVLYQIIMLEANRNMVVLYLMLRQITDNMPSVEIELLII